MSQAVSNMRHDGAQLRESAQMAKEAVTDLAKETGKYANQRLSDAKESAGAMAQTVKEKASKYNEGFIGYVRENPYKSVAIAAGVGLALGILLRRS